MEPDWEKFRVDETFDTEAGKIEKLKSFMHAFIDWRLDSYRDPPATGDTSVVMTDKEPLRFPDSAPKKRSPKRRKRVSK